MRRPTLTAAEIKKLDAIRDEVKRRPASKLKARRKKSHG